MEIELNPLDNKIFFPVDRWHWDYYCRGNRGRGICTAKHVIYCEVDYSSEDLHDYMKPETPRECFTIGSEDGKAIVRDYHCSYTTVRIPEDVRHIGSAAFERSNITSVYISKSLYSVGYKAFYDSDLINIHLSPPEDTIRLNRLSFAGRHYLTRVSLPKRTMFDRFDYSHHIFGENVIVRAR